MKSMIEDKPETLNQNIEENNETKRAFKGTSALKDRGLPWWLRWFEKKKFACNAGDTGLIPGTERSPREGNGNSLQYSCLESPMDRGAWQATDRKSWTQLSD